MRYISAVRLITHLRQVHILYSAYLLLKNMSFPIVFILRGKDTLNFYGIQNAQVKYKQTEI